MAAMAAGELYSRLGDHVTAGARYARAYAAGAGPDGVLRGERNAVLALASFGRGRDITGRWFEAHFGPGDEVYFIR